MLGSYFYVKGAFDSSVPQFWKPYSEAKPLADPASEADAKAVAALGKQFSDSIPTTVTVEWLVSKEGLSNAELRPPYDAPKDVDWGKCFLFFSLAFIRTSFDNPRSKFFFPLCSRADEAREHGVGQLRFVARMYEQILRGD